MYSTSNRYSAETDKWVSVSIVMKIFKMPLTFRSQKFIIVMNCRCIEEDIYASLDILIYINTIHKMGQSSSIKGARYAIEGRKQNSEEHNCAATETSALPQYDTVLALILGGYAFEAYSKPVRLSGV